MPKSRRACLGREVYLGVGVTRKLVGEEIGVGGEEPQVVWEPVDAPLELPVCCEVLLYPGGLVFRLVVFCITHLQA